MTTIRKFIYATLLALTALSIVPSPALAEGPARGEFKLTHEVHWQNAVVPAGEYRFNYESDSGVGVLTLSKISDPRAGFIFMVTDTDQTTAAGVSRLELESTPGGSYVSSMLLPEFGMTLHFNVPTTRVAEKTTLASAGSAK
jgi:hypothetical protein